MKVLPTHSVCDVTVSSTATRSQSPFTPNSLLWDLKQEVSPASDSSLTAGEVSGTDGWPPRGPGRPSSLPRWGRAAGQRGNRRSGVSEVTHGETDDATDTITNDFLFPGSCSSRAATATNGIQSYNDRDTLSEEIKYFVYVYLYMCILYVVWNKLGRNEEAEYLYNRFTSHKGQM